MSTKRPVIGVCPLVDYERKSLWMLPDYLAGIIQAGGLPLMLPLTADDTLNEELITLCDGLLITGGQDVAGQVYGCKDPKELALIGETSPERDIQEEKLLDLAVKRSMPVLGICRGIQIINAHMGGTLWQDLPTQHASGVSHHSDVYGAIAHTVEVLPDTPLSAYLGAGELEVTSLHHQAVKDLAPGLEAMAVSSDGLVEAVWAPDTYFLWAVQWHPELSFKTDEASRQIFRAFIQATAPQELIWV